MNDHQAEIAASLRTIKTLLCFIVGALIAVGWHLSGLPSWLFGVAFVICYFGFYLRIALADVTRERQRQASLQAEWAEEDRRMVIARADRARPSPQG